MFGAIKDLLNSEKAVAGGAIVVCATVLVALGMMTIAEWKELVQWTFAFYVGGKTLTSVAAIVTKKSEPIAEAKAGEPVIVDKDVSVIAQGEVRS